MYTHRSIVPVQQNVTNNWFDGAKNAETTCSNVNNVRMKSSRSRTMLYSKRSLLKILIYVKYGLSLHRQGRILLSIIEVISSFKVSPYPQLNLLEGEGKKYEEGKLRSWTKKREWGWTAKNYVEKLK